MSYFPKRVVATQGVPLLALDAISVAVSFWTALVFRFDGQIPAEDARFVLLALPAIVMIFLFGNLAFGLYRYVWRYTSAGEVLTIGAAGVASTAMVLVGSMLWGADRPVPISVAALGGVLATGAFVVARYRERLLTGLFGRVQRVVGSPNRRRVLIVGAGDAGNIVARQLLADAERRYELAGFVDDDPGKLHMRLHGANVLGGREAIPALVAERGVSLVVIAIHRISGPALRDLLSLCLATPAQVKILPDFLGAIGQQQRALPLRDISPEDLLGRELCDVDAEACRAIVAGKTVLVTGAAGSIGSELCRQLLRLAPRELLILDNNETGVHDLYIELPAEQRALARQVVADVTNASRMNQIFADFRPEVVFHVAAYKHVPMMEYYPDEAVRVNIMGTAIVADLARRYAARRFVFISTDKAVNPSSIMGATKRVGELLMMANAAQPAEAGPQTLFTAVRFGNVLGSRGSVVPTFVRQIDAGGPVTITDTAMTRFFISISEAVSLVIEAATMTGGGDIFMLDMGQPIRIEDLAHKLIRLRGLRPGHDIPVVYTGVRPGEKLHEELTAADETRDRTAHPKLFRIRSSYSCGVAEVPRSAHQLIELALAQRTEDLVALLWQLVRGEPAPTIEIEVAGAPLALMR
ncbi:polysaccharide biosynthesis protein [Kouleothrix sp.]|uniref:polysaccharide biosynthesis protein n=1 Tax=Kouleothrix sp. TaxID=2779161 RepID=UPI003919F19F